ncbi:MAG: hypothetical protein NCW75_15160 [Phycisphaera sp.]|nr:MAG: hypothetical protein NCW75_15160 [Phycisphaera sp.]
MRMVARLVIRVGSFVLFLLAGETLLSWVYYAATPAFGNVPGQVTASYHWWYVAMAALYGAPAACLLTFEPALLRWLVPSPEQRCPSCGYPIAAETVPELCPECGVRLKNQPLDGGSRKDD